MHHAKKAHERQRVKLYIFITSVLNISGQIPVAATLPLKNNLEHGDISLMLLEIKTQLSNSCHYYYSYQMLQRIAHL
jgi:hypothetical protein